MTRYQVGIPQEDASNNTVDTSSLRTAMESIAIDAISHNIGQDTRWQSGNFVEQYGIWYWDIADADLSTAQSNFSTFTSGFTFTHSADQHAWSLTL